MEELFTLAYCNTSNLLFTLSIPQALISTTSMYSHQTKEGTHVPLHLLYTLGDFNFNFCFINPTSRPNLVQKIEFGAFMEMGDLASSHLTFEETVDLNLSNIWSPTFQNSFEPLPCMYLSLPESNPNVYLTWWTSRSLCWKLHVATNIKAIVG